MRTSPSSPPLVLELIGSSYLAGHVLAADGTPAAGAEITGDQPEPTDAVDKGKTGEE